MKTLPAFLSLSSLLLGACAIKIPGVKSGGSTVSSPTIASSGGSSGGSLGGASAGGGDVATAYKQFTFESCRNFDCVGKFRKAAGVSQTSNAKGYMVEMNPRASGKNPDPEWLVGWDSLPKSEMANDADVVYEALVTAAAMKTWQARCYADYEALHAKLAADDQQLATAIDAAKSKPTPAQRIDALLALRTNERLDGLSFEQSLGKLVGARYTLELEILSAYRAADVEYAYFLVNGIAAPAEIVEHGRPRADLATERESYCAAALDGRVETTPQPEQYKSNYLEHGAKAVKSPVDRAAVDKFAATRKTTYAENKKTFAASKSFDNLTHTQEEASVTKGELAHVTTETAVKSVKRSGNKVTIELANLHKNTAPYDCRQTGQLDADLKPVLNCKLRDIIADQHATITFADLPESVKIEPGDHLEMFGTKTSEKVKVLVDSVPLHKSTETWTFEGTYLVRPVR